MMNAVMERLLDLVEKDPLPEQDTSSFWKEYGSPQLFEREGDTLSLLANRFEWVKPMGPADRFLQMLERASYRPVTARLQAFSEVWPIARQLVRDLGGDPHFNVLKSACITALLTDHWRAQRLSPKVFVIIGDGFGFLGALIRRWIPDSTLYLIDLPKMLVLQARTHGLADPQAAMEYLPEEAAAGRSPILFSLPKDIERLPGVVDCAINVASMQEMKPSSITAYFKFLRQRSGRQSHFYCVNRTEKRLPDGEWIRFGDFPWQPEDKVFLNGVCPYYTHFFSSFTLPPGPKVLGLRVPFVNHFDGVHLHRLAHLAHDP